MDEPQPNASQVNVQQADAKGIALVTQRPVAITMLMVAMAVFGVVSLKKLPVDLMPEISYPSLTVRTAWSGAAPEDVEDRISVRLEEALSTLPNLVRASSISRAEASDVVLEFEWGTPMTFAVQDVREKLDAVFLPNGAERPLILRYDPNLDPILRIGVTLADEEEAQLNEAGLRESASIAELVQLRWLAENRIKRELESMPGVAAVLVRGGLEEEIRVRVDPHKLAAQNLNPAVLGQRLASENINASGGSILEGSTQYLVRTLNEFKEVSEIGDLPVERRGDGVIRVRDVADVQRTHAEREVVSRIKGREAVEVAIFREAGANIVEVAQTVKDKVFGTEEQRKHVEEQESGKDGSSGEKSDSKSSSSDSGGRSGGDSGDGSRWKDRDKTNFVAYQLRKDADLEILSDQSTFIQASVDDVRQSAVLGALLAVGIIFLFLRKLAPTLIVGISIPISVVVTFAPMFLFDVSLNLMSLGGLALGVGMLVDNAIVVIESIARCREEGDSLQQAAVRGVREVSGAITASTLTTICVFLPIVFVHGVAGQIFGDQALAVVSSLAVSLIVAVLFIPMLASRTWLAGERSTEKILSPTKLIQGLTFNWIEGPVSVLIVVGRSVLLLLALLLRAIGAVLLVLFKVAGWLLWPIHASFNLFWRTMDAVYPRVLNGALSLSWLVILAAGLLMWDAVKRLPNLGTELLPEIHQGEFTVFTSLDVGRPLEETDRVLQGIAQQIEALPGVELTAATAGVEKDSLTREIEGKHTGRILVRGEDLDVQAELELERAVTDILSAHPAVALTPDVRRPTPFAFAPPVQVEVLGYDLEALEESAQEVIARLDRSEDIGEVKSSVRPGHPELRISFDREKILEYGLNLNEVAAFVRDQVLGNVSTRFNEGDERIDVRVIGDEVILSSVDKVLDMILNPASENPVALRSVASVNRVQGPAEIRRIQNSRAVVVTAKSQGMNLGGLAKAMETQLADLEVPESVEVELGGQKREMDEAQKSMRFALLLAVFLVYVVMASQFESLVQPLIILVSVPLAAVGAIWALQIFGQSLSVIVFIGLIMLAGIVVNNAIVLVDRINQRRASGMPLREAIVEGGRTRLRPILMTTATTVLGLLPLTGWLAGLTMFEGVPVLSTLASIGGGEGAEIRAPLAITVIAGLISSTLLTLLVVPVVYYLVEMVLGLGRSAQPKPANELDASTSETWIPEGSA